MELVQDRLEAWREAGLLSAGQADAIALFERRREPADDARPGRRSRMVEATGYVGAALTLGALALLLAERWDDLLVAGRLVLVGLVTILLLGGGLVLRRLAQDPMRRLSNVLAAASVASVAWLTSIVGGDLLVVHDRDVALAVALAALLAAASLYVTRPSALLNVTMLASVAATVVVLLMRPALDLEPVWFGISLWALGLTWVLLGSGGWLVPRRVAELAGGLGALLAIQATAWDGHRTLLLTLGIATAGVMIGMAIAADATHQLVVGALALFVLVPQLAFALFGDALGAPATMLVTGLLLVLLAVGLARARQGVVASPVVTGGVGGGGSDGR